jgi:predicted dehydrogenase
VVQTNAKTKLATLSHFMSKKIRLALIGAGGISAAHAKGILAHQNKVECVALCDLSDTNLEARALQLGNKPARFGDWKTMLSEFGDKIDAVDICLPHHLHASAIFDAVAAGKHILCEKPMCIDLDEADRITEAVRRAGITYMSAHNQLFKPAVKEAKRMLDEGMLGQVHWIRCQDCFAAPRTAIQGQWRSHSKLQGGGELIDTGYHPTYRLLYLAGASAGEIRGTMGRFSLEMEGEDTAAVQVRFANGIIGEIFTSWAFPQPFGTHEIHVIGKNGELFGSGNRLWHLPRGSEKPAERTLQEVDEFAEEIGHFADSILQGTRPIHSAEEGREVLRIILLAAKNADGWQKTAAANSMSS